MTKFEPAPLPSGRTEIGGRAFMNDARGGFTPVEFVKAADQLEDETVRKIMGHAIALSEQVARFKEHTFDDIGDFDAILA